MLGCVGNEPNLDSCKHMELPQPCQHPAGVVCSRITTDDTLTLLDGLPICAEGFTDKEASALCKEEGYKDGVVTAADSSPFPVTTGWSLKCSTENLHNCKKSVCIDGTAANFKCGNESEVELYGGTHPGEGAVLYKGGLVCDDFWDLEDAHVVCRALGYSGAEKALTHAHFGPPLTPMQKSQGVQIPFTANKVSCSGEENLLSECPHQEDNECDHHEAAGVECIIDAPKIGSKTRRKRQLAAVGALAQTGSNIVMSALEYFDKKEKEKQAWLKERPDAVNLDSAGVEIKMENSKGYMDLGGEFQAGGTQVKIQDIPKPAPKTANGGSAFTYPVGLGPMLMNGCFGSGYTKGDPCYANKRNSQKCLKMIEAANYVGVGFDGTGAYNHAGRRKSLIQRLCANKRLYQGDDLPDNMNIFGIYDSTCSGKTYETLEARSQSQREQAKMGENKDFLRYGSKSKFKLNVKASVGWFSAKASADAKHSSASSKETGTSKSSRGTGEATAKTSKTKTGIFEFSCRIRRYEIFLDEVKPDQLSEAFLQDYMALPIRYFDFKNKAPKKFTDFLLRWGTHYIKSASFGGKFTLLRESTLSGTETKQEWQSRMQNSASQLFESRTSSTNVQMDAKAGIGFTGIGGSANLNTDSEGEQNQDTSASASQESSSKNDKSRTESSFTMDDILVEGGHQRIASILSDKNRAGFKGEFVTWLDSIPTFPKGYDFKFGEISDLLDMNFRSLINKDFTPCWNIPNREIGKDKDGNDISTYKINIKDENGNAKEEIRECHFNSIDDFQEKMDKKRLSLKHAVTLFAKNGGRSWDKVTIPGGDLECEKKEDRNEKISYSKLLDGSSYELAFDLLSPLGNKIQPGETLQILFVRSYDGAGQEIQGRWQVNKDASNAAGQIGKVVKATGNKVFVLGARFTYESDTTGNFLKWTRLDCLYNLKRFKNLQGVIECDLALTGDRNAEIDSEHEEDESGDIDWIGVPLATVASVEPPKEFLPCNMEWSNHQMLMSDESCVRFTASSTGPIYFGLSSVPDKLSTWYYFRITSVTMSFNLHLCITM